MLKTYLVTGGAGFIGSNLIQELLQDSNNKVICIDNFDSYYSKEVKLNNINRSRDNINFEFYDIDILDLLSLKEIFKKYNFNYIIHLAAKAGVRSSFENPLDYAQVNVLGTLNLLDIAKDYNIKKFIFASSSSVYGVNKGLFSEGMKLGKPISPYAASKISAENFCYTYNINYNIPIICLRFFTVYGPYQRPDLAISKFTKFIIENKKIPFYGNGETKRDYTYIDDIISGIISSINYDTTNFEIINLGSNNPITLSNLVEILEQNLGKKASFEKMKIPNGDVPSTFADLTKAEKLLNYKPQINISTGIEKFISWFKENYYK
ncbi:NAD-dependent epimerase/dehydratase family protein [Candidatus Dependentiae bacterium]|nr:NAD-dependent epimerase/dehydratase family protein [Candidatus Dependentiae bacterium]